MRAAEWLADLRWLLLAPALLNPSFVDFQKRIVEFDIDQRALIAAWLDNLEQNNAPLIAWMAAKPPKQIVRLGRYAEHLVEFFLRFGPTHQCIAANLQILAQPNALKKDHTTIGEIDFLLQDDLARNLHWELAVKYFVCRDVVNPGVADLQGPDSAETFDHKIAKIMGKQLAQRPPPPFADQDWHSQAMTRGWMFYRLGGAKPHIPELSSDHCSGFWIERSDISQLEASCFLILPRARWLCPAKVFLGDFEERLLTNELLGSAIDELWQSRMPSDRWPGGVLICEMTKDATSWREVRRGFVMPRGWSKAANALRRQEPA
jgi:uncharacterized protein